MSKQNTSDDDEDYFVAKIGKWTTRDLLVTAVIGLAMSVILTPISIYFTNVTLVWPYLLPVLFSLNVMPGFLSVYAVRAKGASVLANIIVGLVKFFFGGGVHDIMAAVVIGVISELPFALTRYKNFKMKVFIVGAAIINTFIFLMHLSFIPLALGMELLDIFPLWVWILLGIEAIPVGAIIGGVLSKKLADELAKAGVFSKLQKIEEHQTEQNK